MTSPVDPRFGELIDTIRRREWLILIRPNQSLLADLIGVSRTTVWAWEAHKTNIDIKWGREHENKIGLLGYFSDGVLEIHRDLQERKIAELHHESLPRIDVPIVHVNSWGKLSNRRRTTPNDPKPPKRMPRHWK